LIDIGAANGRSTFSNAQSAAALVIRESPFNKGSRMFNIVKDSQSRDQGFDTGRQAIVGVTDRAKTGGCRHLPRFEKGRVMNTHYIEIILNHSQKLYSILKNYF
jgi:hypothetical protein